MAAGFLLSAGMMTGGCGSAKQQQGQQQAMKVTTQTVQVGHADPERVCRLHYGIAGGAGPLESIRYSHGKIRQRR